MGFGDILGQMMQNGLGGQQQTRGQSGAGGGLGGLMSQLQGAMQNSGGGSGGGLQSVLGGLGGKAQDFLGQNQAGSLSGAQVGGIGAIAGALLGGGVGGAAKGGAMAVLGTLALNALKSAQAARAAEAGGPAVTAQELSVAPEEIAAVTGPDAEQLMVKAMISAAKADGNIDQEEMGKIIGKVGEGSVTDAEKAFVMTEMGKPIDIDALAAEVTSPAQAAAVYTASLMAITIDTEHEKAYMSALATALKLDDATVTLLHQTTGAAA